MEEWNKQDSSLGGTVIIEIISATGKELSGASRVETHNEGSSEYSSNRFEANRTRISAQRAGVEHRK